MKNPRLRFAPSPTGELHLGGARTALFNFLFAKQNQGELILRIEDTDQTRFQEGAMERFFADLAWLGIEFDESPIRGGDFGPYVQSQRSDLYKNYAQQLVESGGAYYCFCTPQRLEKMRENQQKSGQKPGYDRHCRNLDKKEISQNLSEQKNFVIRLKVPEFGELVVDDLVRGKVTFQMSDVDDTVLLKSDGFPTYHLANVVDDHLMEITHVMRAEEWLPSTPKHLILYQNFNWQAPQFAHLPLLLAPDKKKLSKRLHGEKVWIGTYKKEGYLPEALVNYLALLGWNPGDDREFFTLDQLIQEFDISRINKAGAIFDNEKLDHFQGHYVRKMDLLDFLKKLEPYKPAGMTDEIFKKSAQIIQTRIIKFADFAKLTSFFVEVSDYSGEKLIFKKSTPEKTLQGLKLAISTLTNLQNWQAKDISDALAQEASEAGLSNGDVFWPVRVALTGEDFSPPPNDCAFVLGKAETLSRLNHALKKLT